MALLSTDAVILHAADYLESSRLVRMLTREAGVVSVVARGMRSSRRRFGSAMDLFAEGQAQLQIKQGRDLHALQGFDVTVARTALAADLDRFAAASALAELILRLVHEEASPTVFARVREGLDRIADGRSRERIHATALATSWQVVAAVGYRPALDECPECHEVIPDGEDGIFSVSLGGLVCLRCTHAARPSGRRLPSSARTVLRNWLAGGGDPVDELDAPLIKAHQRLLREFLSQYLPDSRPLRAFLNWESMT